MIRTRTLVCLLVIAVAVSACSRHEVLRWQQRTYTVQPGDTLYSIAFHHGLDWRVIAEWNRVDPPGYLIRPGQVLRLSPPQAERQVASTPQEPAAGTRPESRPTERTPPPTVPGRREPGWNWPTEGELVARFDTGGGTGKGIGIAGRAGQPIHAASGGRVVYTGSGLVGYGNLIIIKHDTRVLSAYAHNRDILVREQQDVHAGQRIATMGEAPGRRAMLHFEVRVDGQAVDPLQYLPPVRQR